MTLAIRGVPTGEFLVFGIPCQPERGGRWIGEDLPSHGLGCTRSGQELDLLFQPGGRTLCATIPAAPFREAFTILSGLPTERCFPTGSLFKRYPPDRWEGLLRTWSQMLARSADVTDLATELTANLVAFGNAEDVAKDCVSIRARAVFRRAMDAVSNSEESLRPATLARTIGVSLRTLETAFRQCVDLSPARYLRHRRINAVHLELAAADPALTEVTDVALRFGFTELGRFAAEYRQLFGEKPSETLRRAPRKRV